MTQAVGPAPTPPRRPRCPGCALPLPTCLCACVRAVATRVQVGVLQHPAEADHAKGTVRLLQACLGAACTVWVGALDDDPAWLTGSCLLYPHGAEAPAPRAWPEGAVPARLLVLDGSWRQSRALLRQHPALQALPRVALRAPVAGRYGELRKAHRPHQLSTLEAVAAALHELAGETPQRDALLAAQDDWLALQRRWRPPRSPGSPQVPAR